MLLPSVLFKRHMFLRGPVKVVISFACLFVVMVLRFYVYVFFMNIFDWVYTLSYILSVHYVLDTSTVFHSFH